MALQLFEEARNDNKADVMTFNATMANCGKQHLGFKACISMAMLFLRCVSIDVLNPGFWHQNHSGSWRFKLFHHT